MTDSIYNDEAIIRSVTYHGKAGHKISLELDPEGWERLKGMETTRCMMVLVPIQNDGQPDPDVTPTAKPRRPMSEVPRSQQAGILCNDTRFQRFLVRVYDITDGDNDDPAICAAEFVRNFCKVDSRVQLDSEPDRGQVWDQLRTEFDGFTGKIGLPDLGHEMLGNRQEK